jgi:hypothetical protein
LGRSSSLMRSGQMNRHPTNHAAISGAGLFAHVLI